MPATPSIIILTKPATLIVLGEGTLNSTTTIDFSLISNAPEHKITVYNVIGVATTDAAVATTASEPSEAEAPSTSTTGSTLAKSSEGETGDDSTDTTSTASTSETSLAVTLPSSSGGISGGAVAGAAIGCLIAGLALGLIAAFILFRRRRRNSSVSPDFIQATRLDPEPKGGPQVTIASSGHDAELSQFLLEATPDKEIQAELRSLSELIYNHVENYYHGPQVQANSIEVAQSLVNIGYSPELSGLPAETVSAVCLAPKTWHVGLRHVISHIIFRSLDFGSVSGLSMLPIPVAAMALANPSAELANNPGKINPGFSRSLISKAANATTQQSPLRAPGGEASRHCCCIPTPAREHHCLSQKRRLMRMRTPYQMSSTRFCSCLLCRILLASATRRSICRMSSLNAPNWATLFYHSRVTGVLFLATTDRWIKAAGLSCAQVWRSWAIPTERGIDCQWRWLLQRPYLCER